MDDRNKIKRGIFVGRQQDEAPQLIHSVVLDSLAGEEHGDEVERKPLDSRLPHRGDEDVVYRPGDDRLCRCGLNKFGWKSGLERCADLGLRSHRELLAEQIDIEPLVAVG